MKSVYFVVMAFALSVYSTLASPPRPSDDFWDGDSEAHATHFWRGSWNISAFHSDGIPYISVDYGFTRSSIHEDAFAGSISDAGLVELKFGSKQIISKNKEAGVCSMHDSYLFLARSENGLYKKETSTTKIDASTWGLGFGWRGGYGYRLGSEVHLLLTHADELSWSRTDFSNKQNLGTQDTASLMYLETLSDGIRFGNAFEAGIELLPLRNLSVNLAFRREAVLPRTMFWYWALNYGIEQSAQGLVHSFTSAVMKNSPAAGPIVNFILKNAISYGMYELKKKNMNWPTTTVPAYIVDSYKVGISFNF